MANRGVRNQVYGQGNRHGRGYGADAQFGGPGYGYGGGRQGGSIVTPPSYVEQPWAVTEWEDVYIPTVNARQRRPVIYIAAQLPAGGGNQCCGGAGGGFGGGGGGGFPLMR